jgi:hypothetical protein
LSAYRRVIGIVHVLGDYTRCHARAKISIVSRLQACNRIFVGAPSATETLAGAIVVTRKAGCRTVIHESTITALLGGLRIAAAVFVKRTRAAADGSPDMAEFVASVFAAGERNGLRDEASEVCHSSDIRHVKTIKTSIKMHARSKDIPEK